MANKGEYLMRIQNQDHLVPTREWISRYSFASVYYRECNRYSS